MITISEMKSLEDNAEKKGVSKLTLMENAGRGIAKVIEQKTELKDKKVIVVCYHGNNGGDGFVAARYLADKTDVDVLFLGDETKLKAEAKVNFKRIEVDSNIQFISLDYVDIDDYDIIIDALLGIGIQGQLKPILQSTIDAINKSQGFKVSVDIPSGINPDTGEVADRAVDADIIITFHDIKKGIETLKHKTVIVDIGLKK